MYELPNLQPLTDEMVTDSEFGVGWHSDMKSAVVDGRRTFVLDEARRQKIYGIEIHKIRYLHAKLVDRAKLGGLIFVIKANDGIDPEMVDEIFEALSELAAGARFALLEIQAARDPSLIGTVVQRRAGLLRGYVSQFAPYNDAKPRDMDAWASVLDGALGLSTCPDWSKRLAEFHPTKTRINLAFPIGRSQDLTKPIFGDLRAGAAILLRGNTWCRQVGDSFRLHGANPSGPATLLRWVGIYAPGKSELYGTLQCPVEDSIPVNIVVTVRDDSEAVIGEWRSVIAPNDPDTLTLHFAPARNQPVSIEMAAQASRPIQSGERAVVDVSPLSLDPVEAPMAQAAIEPSPAAKRDGAKSAAQIAS